MKLLGTAKVQGHTKKQSRNNIKKLFVEYQEALTEYHEALTKTSCKFVSRFRPHKVRQKRPKDDAKPGQGQAQMPWNGTKKVAQGHPKHTKWVPNWCQNVPRSPKWRPVVNVLFFYEFGPIQGARSAPFSVQNPIKSFKKAVRKSTLEKYHQIILKSWKNLM